MPNPPKPTALRALEGNRSRRELKPDLPLAGVPEPAPWLDDFGREHFMRVAGELTAIGVTKRVDSDALNLLSDYWSKWRQARIVLDMDPFDRKNWQTYFDAGKRWEAFCAKFGLTPSDRVRLCVSESEKPDEIEEMFFRATG